LKTTVRSKKIKRKKGKSVEAVYQELKRLIYFNMLAPGQKLVYQDLASRLNTSTTPVVQALRGLERSNLVRYEPNKGYFVGEINELEAKELFQAREALETYVVRFVIENLNKRKLKSIRGAFEEYSRAMAPEQRRVRMIKDAQFHLKIVEVAGNRVIYGLLEDIFERIYLRYKPEYLWEERIKEAAKEHEGIVTSLEQGDVRGAKTFIRKNVRHGLAYIIRHLRVGANIP
jgi:DNA-binding GntR family transcriptional regulator